MEQLLAAVVAVCAGKGQIDDLRTLRSPQDYAHSRSRGHQALSAIPLGSSKPGKVICCQ